MVSHQSLISEDVNYQSRGIFGIGVESPTAIVPRPMQALGQKKPIAHVKVIDGIEPQNLLIVLRATLRNDMSSFGIKVVRNYADCIAPG